MGLRDLVQKDAGLSQDKKLKLKFLTYADYFDQNLNDNLELTSIELDEKYKTEDISGWRKFLKNGIVRGYVNDFLDEISEKQARKTLGGQVEHARDAIKLKESLEANYKGEDNNNIVVWFLPQKNYGDLNED